MCKKVLTLGHIANLKLYMEPFFTYIEHSWNWLPECEDVDPRDLGVRTLSEDRGHRHEESEVFCSGGADRQMDSGEEQTVQRLLQSLQGAAQFGRQ